MPTSLRRRAALPPSAYWPTCMRNVRIAGDNRAAVWHCAGYARLRRPAMQQVLAGPVATVEGNVWRAGWLAICRRLNAATHKSIVELERVGFRYI